MAWLAHNFLAEGYFLVHVHSHKERGKDLYSASRGPATKSIKFVKQHSCFSSVTFCRLQSHQKRKSSTFRWWAEYINISSLYKIVHYSVENNANHCTIWEISFHMILLKQLALQRIMKAISFYNRRHNNRKKLVWMLRAKQQKKSNFDYLSRKDKNSKHRYIWTVQTLQYFEILQILGNLLLPCYSPSKHVYCMVWHWMLQ